MASGVVVCVVVVVEIAINLVVAVGSLMRLMIKLVDWSLAFGLVVAVTSSGCVVGGCSGGGCCC